MKCQPIRNPLPPGKTRHRRETPLAKKKRRASLSPITESVSKDTLGMTWLEIEALRPPIIIDGFLRWGELMLLGAESKSRKTWLTQDAGFCVASGLPWLADEDGENGFATKQARVHVFDLELAESEMRFRFARARDNRFPDRSDAEAVTEKFISYSLDGLNVEEIYPLLDDLKETVRPGELVIVDCFYRMVPDGNETEAVAAALQVLKRFAKETKTGVILVDHFRKAGADKARDRFAGSFVKQAAPSTLVAIEVTADDMLALSIDARTFHGCDLAHARFNLDTYTFQRVPEAEIQQAKLGRELATATGWLVTLWKARAPDYVMTANGAGELWCMTRQAATTRLRKLVSREWLKETSAGSGKPIGWTLEPLGNEVLKSALNLK